LLVEWEALEWEALKLRYRANTSASATKTTTNSNSFWQPKSPPRGESPKLSSYGDLVGNGTTPIHKPVLTVTATIAPICNKGAYQVITDSKDFHTMGRKV
jgi:hypothetical protein